MNSLLVAKTGMFERGYELAIGAFAAAAIVLLVCYWQTLQSLVWTWDHDGTYQYAFLIFPLSLWLGVGLRHELRACRLVPSIWGIVAVAALVFVWYLGSLLDINLPQHFAFVALFPALVLACWGWHALWVLAFPLGYLVMFAVPWGDGLVGPLQDITAHFAVRALELTGTPALLNGREIITPSAVWMVANACSGVKFFIACSALGCLYAYLMFQGWRKRVVFVMLAAVTPVIANGLRVYFTILIGETWGVKYATGTDHMIFGWQFFGTVLILLLLTGWFFRDPPVIQQDIPVQGGIAIGARSVVWPAVLLLLIAGPLMGATRAALVPVESIRLDAPTVVGWDRSQIVSGDWQPVFNGAAGQVHASYRSNVDGDVIDLFHAVYTGNPRRGHNLITHGNDLYDAADSQILSRTSREIDFVGGRGTTAGELRLAIATGPRLVWYWYCVGSRCTSSTVLTKLWQAWGVLRGDLPPSSVWAVSSPVVSGNLEQSRTKLHGFARALPAPDASDLHVQEPPDIAGGGP